MKIPAKKIFIATFLGAVMLNAGFSFAQNNEPVHKNENIVCISKDEDSEERKREFWEKFRESVKPREEHPSEADRPREVHPREVYPREVD